MFHMIIEKKISISQLVFVLNRRVLLYEIEAEFYII
jgi:hypothetical protein